MKKKLVNKFVKASFIFIFLFAYSNFTFALPKDVYNQGLFLDYDFILKLKDQNMDRADIAGYFGKPNIVLSYDVNCWCYCYHEKTEENIDRVVYLYFSFDYDGHLIDIKYLRMYENGDYKYKKKPLL
ncbi:MAG TPA: hypothetical protein ACYCC7_01110 [Candidatus Azoamicus sp. MARI]